MFIANSVVCSTNRSFLPPAPKSSKYTLKSQTSVFLSTVPDSLVGGVLIVAESGEVVYANPKARELCQKLSSHSSPSETLPDVVWQLCQSLIEGKDLFPDRHLIIESDIDSDRVGQLHLQVRHFEFDRYDRSYLLVTLD